VRARRAARGEEELLLPPLPLLLLLHRRTVDRLELPMAMAAVGTAKVLVRQR